MALVRVGWLLEENRPGNFIYSTPKAVTLSRNKPPSHMAVQSCPAVNELERRYFEVDSPFDLRLRCEKKEEEFEIYAVPDGTRVDDDLIKQNLNLMPRNTWRNQNNPVIQIDCPYAFISDDNVYLTQLPPFLNFNSNYWPGNIIAGRFNITNWPRTLSWAFEWHDFSKDLILKRNTPWFYVYFESENPKDGFKLIEAEYTDELKKFKHSMTETTRYISNTFSLFKTAKVRRPKKLLVEKKYD